MLSLSYERWSISPRIVYSGKGGDAMDEETSLGTDIYSTLGFLKGVLESIRIVGKNLHDPKVALERIMKDTKRGLDQYELYEGAREAE